MYVYSVLTEDKITKLKEKTEELSIKEAIKKAVFHYLKCDCVK